MVARSNYERWDQLWTPDKRFRDTVAGTNRQQSVASCKEKTKDPIKGGKLFTVISGTYLWISPRGRAPYSPAEPGCVARCWCRSCKKFLKYGHHQQRPIKSRKQRQLAGTVFQNKFEKSSAYSVNWKLSAQYHAGSLPEVRYPVTHFEDAVNTYANASRRRIQMKTIQRNHHFWF